MNMETYRDAGAFDALAAEWDGVLARAATDVIFLTHAWQSIWWRHMQPGEPFVIAFRDDAGALQAIIPLFLHEYDGRRVLAIIGSEEISDYLDFIVPREHEAEVCRAVLDYLTSPEAPAWDALDLCNVPPSSTVYRVFLDLARRAGLEAEDRIQETCPVIDLPDSWDAYLMSIDKKQRHEIRRKMRRAEESEVPVSWSVTSDPAALETDMETFLALMSQDPEKEAFLKPAMREHMRATMCCAFEVGCLQLAFLDIGGKRAAAYLNFHYLDRLWIYNSGLDRSFSEYSPGWVLLGDLLQWANQNGIREFDFMRGDEEYKYRFGAVDRFVTRATLVREPQGCPEKVSAG